MVHKAELVENLPTPNSSRITNPFYEQFGTFPNELIEQLKNQAVDENWGEDNHVLKKYLAVNVGWSIRAGRFSTDDGKFCVTAGCLETRYRTPLYLLFVPNENEGPPWVLGATGPERDIYIEEYPEPPNIPKAPELDGSREIVMRHEHLLDDNEDRVEFLRNTPRVAQMCAISGVIQWSINQSLEAPYWYYGKMKYLIPLYLQTREDFSQMPDLKVPVDVRQNTLYVRTILEPSAKYGNARVAVQRHDDVKAWLIASWNSEDEE